MSATENIKKSFKHYAGVIVGAVVGAAVGGSIRYAQTGSSVEGLFGAVGGGVGAAVGARMKLFCEEFDEGEPTLGDFFFYRVCSYGMGFSTGGVVGLLAGQLHPVGLALAGLAGTVASDLIDYKRHINLIKNVNPEFIVGTAVGATVGGAMRYASTGSVFEGIVGAIGGGGGAFAAVAVKSVALFVDPHDGLGDRFVRCVVAATGGGVFGSMVEEGGKLQEFFPRECLIGGVAGILAADLVDYKRQKNRIKKEKLRSLEA